MTPQRNMVAQAMMDQQRMNQDWFRNAATATANQRLAGVTIPATVAAAASGNPALIAMPPMHRSPGYRQSQPNGLFRLGM